MDFKKDLSFEEFKEASYDSWRAQAIKQLKADNLDSLTWKSSANINLQPYYSQYKKSDLRKFDNRINTTHEFALSARWWENRPFVTVKDEKVANELALEALRSGADGVIFHSDSRMDLSKLLREIEVQYCSISFCTNNSQVVADYLESVKSNMEKVNGSILWKSKGSASQFFQEYSGKIPENLNLLSFYDKAFSIDVQLSLVEEFLKSKPGTSISLNVELTEDYFQTIANVKAARILAFQLLKSLNIDVKPEEICIHGISKPFENEKYGPHENMIKSTTAAMAGLIGGVNSISVLPADEENKNVRRVARNVPNMLKEESYFDKVLDPSAGSYFIDHLIEETCKKIWGTYLEKYESSK